MPEQGNSSLPRRGPAAALTQQCRAGDRPWQDASLPTGVRVDALLEALTLQEKLGLLDADKPPTGGVPRLGVPAFEGWNGAAVDTQRLGALASLAAHEHSADPRCPAVRPALPAQSACTAWWMTRPTRAAPTTPPASRHPSAWQPALTRGWRTAWALPSAVKRVRCTTCSVRLTAQSGEVRR